MLKTISFLAFASIFAVSAAHAEPMADDSVTMKIVSVRDVDFSSAHQVRHLYDQLKQVSKEVCDTTQPGPAWRAADDRACELEALSGAVRDLDQPLLTDVAARTEMASTEMASTETVRTQADRRETR